MQKGLERNINQYSLPHQKENTMTHYEAILGHIRADTPCTFNHVKGWAVSQGFGGTQFVKAIEQMIDEGKIMVIDEGSHMVVELISDTI